MALITSNRAPCSRQRGALRVGHHRVYPAVLGRRLHPRLQRPRSEELRPGKKTHTIPVRKLMFFRRSVHCVVGLGPLQSLAHCSTTFPDFLPRIFVGFYTTLKGKRSAVFESTRRQLSSSGSY